MEGKDIQLYRDMMREAVSPLSKKLDDIELKLSNHLVHTAADISGLRANVEWLKSALCRNDVKLTDFNPNNGMREGKQLADIDWMKWIVRLMLASLIGNMITLIFMVLKFFLDKQ